MTIHLVPATKIALAAVQHRYGSEFGVSILETAPGRFYTLEKFEPTDWWLFAASDPHPLVLRGSDCLAVHRTSGEVLFLGIVGD